MAIGTIPPALEKLSGAFRDFLYETAGIYFPDQNKSRLLNHVVARMKVTGIDDPGGYLKKLQLCRGVRGELAEFFNQVTVNETYFFREKAQYEVLRDKVLPDLFAARKQSGRPKVNIWSAACSSGEEAYSLAILLKESFPGELLTTTITGFDINSDVIDKAKAARYAEYSVRHCDADQKSNYFKKSENTYELVPYIKHMVSFRVANFSDGVQLRGLPRPDLVFCRNVLIYFDKESKARVLENLSKAMDPEGLLFLSNTETLFGVEHSFEMVNFFRVRGYRLKK